LWRPRVAAFLARSGAAYRDGLADEPRPLMSAVPDPLGTTGAKVWFWYLNAADHRAISVAANGDVWAVAYQDSIEDAAGRAMAQCMSSGAEGCRLLSQDGAIPDAPPSRAAAWMLRRVTVRPGTRTVLCTETRWNKGCVATPLAAHEIVYQPRHGVLEGVVETAAVSALNPAARWAHCTHQVPVRRLYYTPDAGFAGTDTLIAEQVTHSGRRALFRVDIQVDAARSAAAAGPAEPDAD